MSKHGGKTHLERQIDEETDDERRIKAGKTGSAEATGEGSRASVTRFSGSGPELTPIGALPLNVILAVEKKTSG